MRRLIERLTVLSIFLFDFQLVKRFLYPELNQSSFELVNAGPHWDLAIIGAVQSILIAYFMLLRYKHVIRGVRYSWYIFLLPCLALASTTWSADPSVTLRRSLVLIFSAVTAVYMAEAFTIEEIGSLYLAAIAFVMAGSLVAFIVSPAYVADPGQDLAWRGIAVQKNPFGSMMCQGAIYGLLLLQRNWGRLRWPFIVIALVLLVLSKSSTAIVLAAALFALLPIMPLVRSKPRILIVLLPIGLIALYGTFLVLPHLEGIVFNSSGKDDTFSGRTTIWTLLLAKIAQHPLFGYGYSAFWEGLGGESLSIVIGAGWLVPNGHNGYIDLVLDLGCFGLVTYVYFFSRVLRDAVKYLRDNSQLAGAWPAYVLVYISLHSLTESDLAAYGTVNFLMLMYLAHALAKDKAENPAIEETARFVRSKLMAAT